MIFLHIIVGELEKMGVGSAAVLYLKLGYQHILPLGFDHILFIVSLCLLSPRLKPVLWQATAFTVAHSVTLGLAMYHVITPAVRIIEPAIALSIVFVALQNIWQSAKAPMSVRSGDAISIWRVGIVFLFGLVHGLGFAGALGRLGLPQSSYLLSLVMFNAGVELGQVTIILGVWFLIGKWFADKPWYRQRIVIPTSILIAGIATYWTIQRLFF